MFLMPDCCRIFGWATVHTGYLSTESAKTANRLRHWILERMMTQWGTVTIRPMEKKPMHTGRWTRWMGKLFGRRSKGFPIHILTTTDAEGQIVVGHLASHSPTRAARASQGL